MISSKPRPVSAPHDGAKRDVYARFIPREEVSSFAAWALDDVSGVPGPGNRTAPAGAGSFGGGAMPGPAPGRAAEPGPRVDPAEVLAQQMRAARQAGYQDGYRDGLVALEGFKQSFAAQTTAQVGALVAGLSEQLDAMQQEMASSLAATAAALARQVVRSELSARPESIVAVAEQAVEALLLSARHIVLRVHPDDYALIGRGAAETLSARGARLVADATIGRGGCLLQSDIGLVDATIDERWRRAATGLGSEQPWLDAADATATTAATAPTAPTAAPAEGPQA